MSLYNLQETTNLQYEEIVVGYIDNDPAAVKSFTSILRKKGLNILSTDKVSVAKEWLKKNKIHILVSDWKMKTNGDEILLQFREFDTIIPFILYSGHSGFKYYSNPLLDINNIEKHHKINVSKLHLVIKAMVNDLRYNNNDKFNSISQNSEDLLIPKNYNSSKEEYGLDYYTAEKFIKEYKQIIIDDFQRIREEGGDSVTLNVSEDLELNIVEAIASLENFDKDGQILFKFWMDGFFKIMKR